MKSVLSLSHCTGSASFTVKSNVHSGIKVSLFSVHLLRLSLFVKSAFSSNIH